VHYFLYTSEVQLNNTILTSQKNLSKLARSSNREERLVYEAADGKDEHTDTHTILTTIFQVNPGLAGSPRSSVSILCVSGQNSISLLTQSHQVFFGLHQFLTDGQDERQEEKIHRNERYYMAPLSEGRKFYGMTSRLYKISDYSLAVIIS